MSKKEKKITPLKAPNPILILVAIVLFCAVATYIVPAGVFDRIADPSTGRMIVDPNSFHYVEQNPVKLFDISSAAPLALWMPLERSAAEWATWSKRWREKSFS